MNPIQFSKAKRPMSSSRHLTTLQTKNLYTTQSSSSPSYFLSSLLSSNSRHLFSLALLSLIWHLPPLSIPSPEFALVFSDEPNKKTDRHPLSSREERWWVVEAPFISCQLIFEGNGWMERKKKRVSLSSHLQSLGIGLIVTPSYWLVNPIHWEIGNPMRLWIHPTKIKPKTGFSSTC